MSAWMLKDVHHNLIATAAAEYGVIPDTEAAKQTAAERLKSANTASLRCRYGSSPAGAISYRRPAMAQDGCDPLLVLKALSCWTYQSCECGPHDDALADFVTGLERAAVDRLPDEERRPDYWSNDRFATLPWSIRADVALVAS